MNVLKTISTIARLRNIKILVSSRPTSACFYVCSKGTGLRQQNLTERDILNYIENELLSMDSTKKMEHKAELYEMITTRLTGNVCGVFLWIVLVVKELLYLPCRQR